MDNELDEKTALEYAAEAGIEFQDEFHVEGDDEAFGTRKQAEIHARELGNTKPNIIQTRRRKV